MSGNYGYRGGRYDNNGQQRRNSGRGRDRGQFNGRVDDNHGHNRYDHDRRRDSRFHKRMRYNNDPRERYQVSLRDGDAPREVYRDRLRDGDSREYNQDRSRDGESREFYHNRPRDDDSRDGYRPHNGPGYQSWQEEGDSSNRHDSRGERMRDRYNFTGRNIQEGALQEGVTRESTPRGRPSSESHVHREREHSPATTKRNMSLGERPIEHKPIDRGSTTKHAQPEVADRESIKPAAKIYTCPWIRNLGITSQSCSESLEKRYLQVKEADEAILEAYAQRIRLEQSANIIARHLHREQLNVSLTTEKLEEFTYI